MCTCAVSLHSTTQRTRAHRELFLHCADAFPLLRRTRIRLPQRVLCPSSYACFVCLCSRLFHRFQITFAFIAGLCCLFVRFLRLFHKVSNHVLLRVGLHQPLKVFFAICLYWCMFCSFGSFYLCIYASPTLFLSLSLSLCAPFFVFLFFFFAAI